MARMDDKTRHLKPEMRWLAATLGSGVKVLPDDGVQANSVEWHDARDRRWTFVAQHRPKTEAVDEPRVGEETDWNLLASIRSALVSTLEALTSSDPRLGASRTTAGPRDADDVPSAAPDGTTPSSALPLVQEAAGMLVSPEWLAEKWPTPESPSPRSTRARIGSTGDPYRERSVSPSSSRLRTRRRSSRIHRRWRTCSSTTKWTLA